MFSYQNLSAKILIYLIKNERNMTVSGSCNPFSYLDQMSCPYPPRGLPPRSTVSLRLKSSHWRNSLCKSKGNRYFRCRRSNVRNIKFDTH